MTGERWRELAEGGVADLSTRAKWLVRGEDRLRYLNGQVTQNVRALRPKSAIRSCVTDHKGKVFGDLFMRLTEKEDGVLVDADGSLRETLYARLDRYIVADDVELVDVTDDWALYHFFGAASAEAPAAAVACRRLGCPGFDLWLPAGERLEMPLVAPEEWEVLRVLRGVAGHPNELNEGVFPPEAGLEEETMDYTKGCYIGQEVLSRIRSTGRMPRVLVKWIVDGEGAGIKPEAEIKLPQDGRIVGAVTSVVVHPLSGQACGLGYIKQGAVPADSRLLVADQLANILPLNQDFPICSR